MTPHLVAPIPHLADITRFVYRQVRTCEEQQQAQALRCAVYSEVLGLTHLPSLDHTTGMDLDPFDLTSRHLALFACDGRRESVVGTLRITSAEPSPTAWALHEIASGRPSLVSRLSAARGTPLPMLSYLVQAPAVRQKYDQWISGGERIAEAGRLTVHPELRVSALRAGVRLSEFLVLCAQATAWYTLKLDRVLVDCNPALQPLYRRFGFESVPGGEPQYQPEMDITFVVLQATPDSLPPALRPEVERLAEQLRVQGEAVLDPDAAGVRSWRAHPSAVSPNPRTQIASSAAA